MFSFDNRLVDLYTAGEAEKVLTIRDYSRLHHLLISLRLIILLFKIGRIL